MTKIRLPGGNFIFKLPIQWIKLTPPGFEHASFVSLTVYFKNFRDKRNWKNLQFVRSGNLCGFKRSGDICYVVKIIISKQTVHMSQYMKSNQPFRNTCWTFFFFFLHSASDIYHQSGNSSALTHSTICCPPDPHKQLTCSLQAGSHLLIAFYSKGPEIILRGR